MMCSSCVLCMALANGRLDLPYFRRRQHAGKRGILAPPSARFVVGFQDPAEVADRAFQQRLPFAVATDEGGGVRVLQQPAGEVVVSRLRERWMFTEAVGLRRPKSPPPHVVGYPAPFGHSDRLMVSRVESAYVNDRRTIAFWRGRLDEVGMVMDEAGEALL